MADPKDIRKRIAGLGLNAQQLEAVMADDPVLRIVACAGSGKTTTIACRIARLLLEGTPPEGLVAFTFTERAATELQERILSLLVRLDPATPVERYAAMFIGTIHGYCHNFLVTHSPDYGNHEILEPHRQVALLRREYRRLGLDKLIPLLPPDPVDPYGLEPPERSESRSSAKLWKALLAFKANVDAVHNELIELPDDDGHPFVRSYREYRSILEEHRLLGFGDLIAKSVELLRRPEVAAKVRNTLRHLIVDEYQDINPAQDRLIRLLAAPPVRLCVVGDDDQCIYQWRGSDVSLIRDFEAGRSGVRTIRLDTNYRSRPDIIRAANLFAPTIEPRIPKSMVPQREPSGDAQVVLWEAQDDLEEAHTVARTVRRLREKGYRYKDIAVLLRSVRTSGDAVISALEAERIPYVCSSNFVTETVMTFGPLYAWLAQRPWSDDLYDPQPAPGQPPVTEEEAAERLLDAGLCDLDEDNLVERLLTWRREVLQTKHPRLLADFYRLLNLLGVSASTRNASSAAVQMAARFALILDNFERTARLRPGDGEPHAPAQGPTLLRGLAQYLQFYAFRYYDIDPDEPPADVDAVNILTVHQAKGLEWPVVFIPCLTPKRFPSSKTGERKPWFLPKSVFPDSLRRRYEGSVTDERRLFYVALTRGRDIVYLSYHWRKHLSGAKYPYNPSLFWEDIRQGFPVVSHGLSLPVPDRPSPPPEKPVTVRELDVTAILTYLRCGFQYHLAHQLRLPRLLSSAIGYGRAAHHILRTLYEQVRSTGRLPTDADIDDAVERHFHVPYADPVTYRNLREKVRRSLRDYFRLHADDARRLHACELPLRTVIDGVTVSGRADLVLDREEGRKGTYAVLDFKTAEETKDNPFAMPLQVLLYGVAASQAGLPVAAAYIHSLSDNTRRRFPVDPDTLRRTVGTVTDVIRSIRDGRFPPTDDPKTCQDCDYRLLCSHRKGTERGNMQKPHGASRHAQARR